MITKEDVVFLNDVETIIWKENGWAITYHRDFFNEHEWFEIQCPDGAYIWEDYKTIYEAIDALKYWKENLKI